MFELWPTRSVAVRLLSCLKTYKQCNQTPQQLVRSTRGFVSANGGNTVDANEVTKFSKLSRRWWDTKGPMAPLHKMNGERLSYIREKLVLYFQRDRFSPTPLRELSILDIGCGAGLLSESLARLGGRVDAIDASNSNIGVAIEHAKRDPILKDNLQYACTTLEDLVTKDKKYDVVISLEVIEHVSNVAHFIESASKLLKEGGVLVLSTINRTIEAYLLTILAAEKVLRWVPEGTHEWKKYVRPEELVLLLSNERVATHQVIGLRFNPLNSSWNRSSNLSTNYFLFATKTPITIPI